MHAISLLKQDHGNIEALFNRFEHLSADTPPAEQRHVVELILEQLSVHAEIEEQVFYPALQAKLDDTFPVLEALEEHHVAKSTLAELDRLPATAERFRAKTIVLIESVRHHLEEEEGEDGLFEQARTAFTAAELEELGQRMEDAKKVVPSRPHPHAPNQAPLNALLGLPVAVVDLVVTTARRSLNDLFRKAA